MIFGWNLKLKRLGNCTKNLQAQTYHSKGLWIFDGSQVKHLEQFFQCWLLISCSLLFSFFFTHYDNPIYFAWTIRYRLLCEIESDFGWEHTVWYSLNLIKYIYRVGLSRHRYESLGTTSRSKLELFIQTRAKQKTIHQRLMICPQRFSFLYYQFFGSCIS